MLNIDTNYPRRTFRVRDLTTGQVVMRQAIIWRPTADAGEAVSRNTATKGGGARHGHYSPRLKKTSDDTSSLGSLETVSEEPKSEQHKPGGAGGSEGGFVLESVEHEVRGVFWAGRGNFGGAKTGKQAFLPEPEAGESRDSSDYESEPEPDQGDQSGAHQEIPATVRKLYDSFTGAPQPITQSRTGSGRDINHLPPEPTTLREAQASSEWPNWQCARRSEMDGQLACQVWKVVPRTKGKTVLGTKTIFKRKIGKDG